MDCTNCWERPLKIDDPRRRWKRRTWKQHTTLPPSVAFHVKKRDASMVLCLNCGKLGRYAKKCPERKQQSKQTKENKSCHLSEMQLKRGTMQEDAQRKVLLDFSELE
jgi:RNase P subunit RPR2